METTIDNNGIEHVIIEREDGSNLSMPKAEYDRQQAEQSTPMVSDDPKP